MTDTERRLLERQRKKAEREESLRQAMAAMEEEANRKRAEKSKSPLPVRSVPLFEGPKVLSTRRRPAQSSTLANHMAIFGGAVQTNKHFAEEEKTKYQIGETNKTASSLATIDKEETAQVGNEQEQSDQVATVVLKNQEVIPIEKSNTLPASEVPTLADKVMEQSTEAHKEPIEKKEKAESIYASEDSPIQAQSPALPKQEVADIADPRVKASEAGYPFSDVESLSDLDEPQTGLPEVSKASLPYANITEETAGIEMLHDLDYPMDNEAKVSSDTTTVCEKSKPSLPEKPSSLKSLGTPSFVTAASAKESDATTPASSKPRDKGVQPPRWVSNATSKHLAEMERQKKEEEDRRKVFERIRGAKYGRPSSVPVESKYNSPVVLPTPKKPQNLSEPVQSPQVIKSKIEPSKIGVTARSGDDANLSILSKPTHLTSPQPSPQSRPSDSSQSPTDLAVSPKQGKVTESANPSISIAKKEHEVANPRIMPTVGTLSEFTIVPAKPLIMRKPTMEELNAKKYTGIKVQKPTPMPSTKPSPITFIGVSESTDNAEASQREAASESKFERYANNDEAMAKSLPLKDAPAIPVKPGRMPSVARSYISLAEKETNDSSWSADEDDVKAPLESAGRPADIFGPRLKRVPKRTSFDAGSRDNDEEVDSKVKETPITSVASHKSVQSSSYGGFALPGMASSKIPPSFDRYQRATHTDDEPTPPYLSASAAQQSSPRGLALPGLTRAGASTLRGPRPNPRSKSRSSGLSSPIKNFDRAPQEALPNKQLSESTLLPDTQKLSHPTKSRPRAQKSRRPPTKASTQ
ncbi:hypothetical protein BZG36_01575 [Bifiguratus adelaidae]|uniref:Uncharacterized protein n=1 Tax=Bifiguratus adelaidae TaxID=1938954 RepID=A0A261Y3Y4_9FUNG|nr:hypothetical protein BZG36_01575 [Bifiguratus adelaidae]